MSRKPEQESDAKNPEGFSIEESLERLEAIAREMEVGELGLEEAMDRYEEGMRLSASCEGYLKDLKVRIEKLSHGTDAPE